MIDIEKDGQHFAQISDSDAEILVEKLKPLANQWGQVISMWSTTKLGPEQIRIVFGDYVENDHSISMECKELFRRMRQSGGTYVFHGD